MKTIANKDFNIETIKSRSDLEAFLQSKAMNHYTYKHYCSVQTVEKILEGSILLTDGSNWNDTVDRDSFMQDDGKKRFAICFNYSRSESMPMWFMYAKEGCYIDFQKNLIESIIVNTNSIDLYKCCDSAQPCLTLYKPDFSISIIDIVYYGDSKEDPEYSYYVRHSDVSIKSIPRNYIDGLHHCRKTLPWSYENECRIIVEIDKSILNTDITALKIKFDHSRLEELRNRVVMSPNCDSGQYCLSKLHGKINF